MLFLLFALSSVLRRKLGRKERKRTSHEKANMHGSKREEEIFLLSLDSECMFAGRPSEQIPKTNRARER